MARWCLRQRSGFSPCVLAAWLRRFSPTTRGTRRQERRPAPSVSTAWAPMWMRASPAGYSPNSRCAGAASTSTPALASARESTRTPIRSAIAFPSRPSTNSRPTAKCWLGLGNGSWLTGTAFVITYGGGVDYRLNRKFTIRCADFEYQEWPVSNSDNFLHHLAVWPQRRHELQDLLRAGNKGPREQGNKKTGEQENKGQETERRFLKGTAACVFSVAFLDVFVRRSDRGGAP